MLKTLMHSFLLAAAVAAGVVGTAQAADMPLKAVPLPVGYSWAGFYLGGHAGGGWAKSDARWDPLPSPAAFNADPVLLGLKGSGFVGGIHGGYNWAVSPAWVLGIEADYSWSDLNNSASQTVNFFGGVPAPPARVDLGRDVKSLGSVRGRIGYAFAPRTLLYVTGGYAWGEVGYNAYYQNNGLTYLAPVSFKSTESGYVVGGGIEQAITNNWILRGEYLFYRLSGASSRFNSVAFPAFPINFSWSETDIHVVRAGVSYKF
jgi:outer membrane immunogenic protein